VVGFSLCLKEIGRTCIKMPYPSVIYQKVYPVR
jgi:hypothetical protein